MLPDYLAKASPNPSSNRAPWYKNTAPSYAGVFLWIAFYQTIANNTVNRAGLSILLPALLAAGLLSFALYYYVPAMLGMKTGYPLYVVGSSTFGTAGGYLMPGLLMGLLQVGWFAVATTLSTSFILKGAGSNAGPGSLPFIVVAVVWAYLLAYVGVKGIQYVARVSLLLNLIPFLMVLIVFFQTKGGLAMRKVEHAEPWAAAALLIQVVIGFFATAGAAGADFGMSNRDARDVRWGGLVGIALAILYAGGLPLISVAAAKAMHPELSALTYEAVIGSIGGFLATAMFFLFAIASVTPTCFCAFIAGNSFSTMIPGVPRMGSTMAGVTVAVILAITGVAGNLVQVFNIVGASFGPICGAMAADYLLSGKKWAGPRAGINWAGYIAWAIGFVIGLLPMIAPDLGAKAQPVVVWSFVAGFVVYYILAKAGLEPNTVPMEQASAKSAS